MFVDQAGNLDAPLGHDFQDRLKQAVLLFGLMVFHQAFFQSFDLGRQSAHRFIVGQAIAQSVQRHLHLIEVEVNLTMLLKGVLGALLECLEFSHRPGLPLPNFRSRLDHHHNLLQ